MSEANEQPSNTLSHEDMLKKLQQSMRVSLGKTAPEATFDAPSYADIEHPSRALYLIQAWRMHGHLHADLDPLRQNPRKPSPEMELAYYGLSDADLDSAFPTGDLVGPPSMRLRDILDVLNKTYCGHIAPELMHITDTARRQWLQQRLESSSSTPSYDSEARKQIFAMVMKAEEFERFLHTRYTGQKRFSLEGGESLIPMLNMLVLNAGQKGVKEVILGMAHRGRLNVLANVLGKSLTDIFAEFEGNQFLDADSNAGDVKYHMGFSSDINTAGGTVHLSLGFNPSHLEI
ncbi:MAG: thiamine pyrophosphate-dependent enzyme, partial [Ghiorsea sp.]